MIYKSLGENIGKMVTLFCKLKKQQKSPRQDQQNIDLFFLQKHLPYYQPNTNEWRCGIYVRKTLALKKILPLVVTNLTKCLEVPIQGAAEESLWLLVTIPM